MKKNYWDFSSEEVIKRAIECLTEKDLREVKDSKGLIKKKALTRFEIDEQYHNYQYPISLPAWDSYKKTISKNAKTGTSSMNLESLYRICVYTGVSADYMLGFIDTKHKEQSAEKVREEFGLTDKSMETLKAFLDTRFIWGNPEIFKPIEFLNFILDDTFVTICNQVRETLIVLADIYDYLDFDNTSIGLEDLSTETKAKLPPEAVSNNSSFKSFCLSIKRRKKVLYEKKYYFAELMGNITERFYKELIKRDTKKETDE